MQSLFTLFFLESFRSIRQVLRECPSRMVRLNLFYNPQKSSESTYHREQYSTRVYILLVIMSVIILLIYNIFARQTITENVDSPTEEDYHQLQESKYELSLKCPCSHNLILQRKFMQIRTTIHEVCLSPFIEEDWIKSMFIHGNWSNLHSNDFHRRGALYFQGLRLFCFLHYDKSSHNDSSFLGTHLISIQLLSETQLMMQMNATVKNVLKSSRGDYSMMYKNARDFINNNQMLSIYSSNWVFSPMTNMNDFVDVPISMEPVSYGNCSCATSSVCFESVTLYGQIIPGFVISCIPLQSLFLSTLACLYNETCIEQINNNHLSVTPLIRSSNSQFSINRTIEEIIDNAFDIDWFVNVNYSNYFNACRPSNCTYSVERQKDAVEIIVILLGLYGGLTTTLHIIIPYMIACVYVLISKCQRSSNVVHHHTDQKTTDDLCN